MPSEHTEPPPGSLRSERSEPRSEPTSAPAPGTIEAELHVSDLDASVAFYELLGLDVRRGDTWARVRVPGVHGPRLRLQADAYIRSHEHYFTPYLDRRPRGVGVELCIEVAEPVDDVAARVRPTGAIVRELTDREWGARDFRVADPDGFFVRITTPIPRQSPHGATEPTPANTEEAAS